MNIFKRFTQKFNAFSTGHAETPYDDKKRDPFSEEEDEEDDIFGKKKKKKKKKMDLKKYVEKPPGIDSAA
ncbi:hypothetical protein ACFLZV_04680 [Candidatus Margulisiibacteriota bacterium]